MTKIEGHLDTSKLIRLLRVFEQTLRLRYSKAARVMLFLQRRSTVLESSKKSDDEMGNIDIMLENL